ncbi:MAG: sugar ABC transporter ATP-binding protein, partial [Phycisphaerales bacterium]|nr:sugar ABC transporter ATP-binding protein [Phycisphaerales bacterium]
MAASDAGVTGVQDNPGAFLVVENVSKRFGVTRALTGVSCSFRAGEVHALMGENGAGKSTLGKAIAGLHKPDSGRIVLDGRELRPGSLDDAFAHGVRIVHQELAQCPNLSVAENLCLHHLPRTRLGLVDFRAMADRAAAIVRRLDPTIDVSAPLGSLAPGRRQICQIAAAMDEGVATHKGASKPRVIVFDEPTSSLSVSEADRLLSIVRRIAADGITVIYVSHRMGEIFQACDRVTVLRDGRFIATTPIGQIDEAGLVEQMLGRRLGDGGEAAAIRELSGGTPPDQESPASPGSPGAAHGPAPVGRAEAVLRVASLSSPGTINDISLDVRPGEIVGIGGLVGAGRSEVLDAIFGVDPRASGTVSVGGQAIPRGRPRAMIRAGVGYVPEDRRLQGLFFQLGVGENIVVPFMKRLAGPLGVRRFGAERSLVAQRMGEFQVKAASPRSQPGELSGGNQQKLLIARWLGPRTKVLLLDEPTRG